MPAGAPAPPAHFTRTWSMVPPGQGTPPQSPGSGAVAVPSPFLSPPPAWSLIDVRMTGSSPVPRIAQPATSGNVTDGAVNLTTTPLSRTRVSDADTCGETLHTMHVPK